MKISTTLVLACLASTSLVMAADGCESILPSLDAPIGRAASTQYNDDREIIFDSIAQGDVEVLTLLNTSFSTLSINDFNDIREALLVLSSSGDKETTITRINEIAKLITKESTLTDTLASLTISASIPTTDTESQDHIPTPSAPLPTRTITDLPGIATEDTRTTATTETETTTTTATTGTETTTATATVAQGGLTGNTYGVDEDEDDNTEEEAAATQAAFDLADQIAAQLLEEDEDEGTHQDTGAGAPAAEDLSEEDRRAIETTLAKQASAN